MADNLTISVGADSSKLRADLAVAQEKVKEFAAQLRAAARESAKGTGNKEELLRLAAQYDDAAGRAKALQGAVRGIGAAHEEIRGPLRKAGHAVHEFGKGFKETVHGLKESAAEVKEAFSRMGEHIFGEHFREALALGSAASAAALYEFVHSSAEAADQVEKSAESLGLGIKAYQELRYAAIQAGLSTDDFGRSIERLATAVQTGAQQQQKSLITVGKSLFGGVQTNAPAVFRGGAGSGNESEAMVLHGGSQSSPGFLYFGQHTLQRVAPLAQTLKTALNLEGVGRGLGLAAIETKIAAIADGTGKAAEALRKQLRLFGIDLAPRTIGGALDNLAQTWTGKLSALGISVLDPMTLQMRSLDTILGDIAHKFRAMPDGAEKVQLAQHIFGRRRGPEIIPFLDRGRRGIAEWRAEFEKLGIAFSETDTKIGRQAVEAFETLGIAIAGVKNQLGLVFAPVFTPLINELTHAIAANAGAMKAWAQAIAAEVKPVVDDFILMLRGKDKEVHTKWLLDLRRDFVAFADGVKAAMPTIESAFRGIYEVLNFVAEGFNKVFGTHYNAASIGIMLAVVKLTGAFGLLGPAIGLADVMMSSFVTRPLAGLVELAARFGLLRGAVGLLMAPFQALGEAIVGVGAAFALPEIAVAAFAAAMGVALGLAAAAIIHWRTQIAAGFVALWTAIDGGATGAFKSIADAWDWAVGWIEGGIMRLSKFFDWLAAKVKAIAGAIGALFGGKSGGAGLAAGLAAGAGHAAGGLIRGPGSGTSDSIPARLSNGEYVIRAAAVSHYGSAALDRLNAMRAHVGYRMGGLVGVPSTAPLRFAAGGLVSGGGGSGTTINLSIDGHHFEGLSAPDGTAQQLVRFARGRQMAAAGRKPSWYGS